MTIYAGKDVRLSSIRSNAILIERPKRPSLPDSHDVYLAVVLLSGEYFLEQDGRQVSLKPGDMTIYDATRPHKIYCPGKFSKLIVSLPRATTRAFRPKSTAARRCESPAPRSWRDDRVVYPVLRGPCGRVDRGCLRCGGQSLRRSDRLVLLEPSEHHRTDRGRDATLRRVKRFIESRLGDPRLDPAMAAQALGLSSRYLNALFEAEGLSLMRYVWARRLENCRRDLCADACAPIGEIAYRWGFSDLSHFSRAFRRRFGQSAREARAGSK